MSFLSSFSTFDKVPFLSYRSITRFFSGFARCFWTGWSSFFGYGEKFSHQLIDQNTILWLSSSYCLFLILNLTFFEKSQDRSVSSFLTTISVLKLSFFSTPAFSCLSQKGILAKRLAYSDPMELHSKTFYSGAHSWTKFAPWRGCHKGHRESQIWQLEYGIFMMFWTLLIITCDYDQFYIFLQQLIGILLPFGSIPWRSEETLW